MSRTHRRRPLAIACLPMKKHTGRAKKALATELPADLDELPAGFCCPKCAVIVEAEGSLETEIVAFMSEHNHPGIELEIVAKLPSGDFVVTDTFTLPS